MPELPEIETTRRGIMDYVCRHTFKKIIIRQPQLRWPITVGLSQKLCAENITEVKRRAKYLIFTTKRGYMLIHLGMSGSLRLIDAGIPANKHDHVDFIFDNNQCMRYTDPRRFGAILWTDENPNQHKLIKYLGPEPLSRDFNTDYLFEKSKHHKIAIKELIMTNKIVVGVGNIYATEALFLAGISPLRRTNDITKRECCQIIYSIKSTLNKAIRAGGTTLKDFKQADGQPGYFHQQLNVYGKFSQPCPWCNHLLVKANIGQRASVYCKHCQK